MPFTLKILILNYVVLDKYRIYLSKKSKQLTPKGILENIYIMCGSMSEAKKHQHVLNLSWKKEITDILFFKLY